jgi:hypothetical protein
MTTLVIHGGPFILGRKAGNDWHVFEQGFNTADAAVEFAQQQAPGEYIVLDMRDIKPKSVRNVVVSQKRH